MYPYPKDNMFECSKTFSIVFVGLILMTAGFCLTMAGWFAPPINQFVAGVRMAGPVTLLVGLVILLCSCLMCAVVQRKCCVCCYGYLDKRKARRKRESAQQIVTNPHNPLIFNDMQDSFADNGGRIQAEYYFDTSASTKGRGNGYFRGENTKVSGLSERDEDYSNCVVVRNDSAQEGTPISTPTIKVKVRQLPANDSDVLSESDSAAGFADLIHVNPGYTSGRRPPGKSKERRSHSASPSRRRKHSNGHAHSDSEKLTTTNGSYRARPTGREMEYPTGKMHQYSPELHHQSPHKSAEQRAMERELMRREHALARRDPKLYDPSRGQQGEGKEGEEGEGEEESIWQEQPGFPCSSWSQNELANPQNKSSPSLTRLVQDERLLPNCRQTFRENNGMSDAQSQLQLHKNQLSSSFSHSGSPRMKPAIRCASQTIVLPKPGQYRERDRSRRTGREPRRRRGDSEGSTPPRLTPPARERVGHGQAGVSGAVQPPPPYTDIVQHSVV